MMLATAGADAWRGLADWSTAGRFHDCSRLSCLLVQPRTSCSALATRGSGTTGLRRLPLV